MISGEGGEKLLNPFQPLFDFYTLWKVEPWLKMGYFGNIRQYKKQNLDTIPKTIHMIFK